MAKHGQGNWRHHDAADPTRLLCGITDVERSAGADGVRVLGFRFFLLVFMVALAGITALATCWMAIAGAPIGLEDGQGTKENMADRISRP